MELDLIAQYRRDGYTIIHQLLSEQHVGACIDALTRLAEEATPAGAFIALEPHRPG
jgi:hypothetical protein